MPFSGRRPRIHYVVRGQAGDPALVLLAGLGRTLRHWLTLADELAPGLRLVLVDSRGVGLSDATRLPYATADMADDVARVLDDARIERAHVFGTSLGGMVAQRVAIDHPARVNRLVLGCTTPGGREALPPDWKTLVSLMRTHLFPRRSGVAAEARLLLSPAYVEAHPEVVDGWLALERELPVPRYALALQLLAASRHRADVELPRITAPTLILSSEEDPLVSPENSRLMARRIRGAELGWISGNAHDFATTRPQGTARLVRHFLGL